MNLSVHARKIVLHCDGCIGLAFPVYTQCNDNYANFNFNMGQGLRLHWFPIKIRNFGTSLKNLHSV